MTSRLLPLAVYWAVVLFILWAVIFWERVRRPMIQFVQKLPIRPPGD